MRIYLAGPEVFLADALALAAEKKAICARHGAEGIFPLDPRPDALADAEPRLWLSIALRNEAHIRAADALIANLTPFRGPSADAGTVYEVGYMRGLGGKVAGYSNTATHFSARTLAFLGEKARRRADGDWEDAEGLSLEDFGLNDNLMIDGGIIASGGVLELEEVPADRRWHDLAAFERCVKALVAG
ncbi:nucleoside 2-deoxyribosyltransferase [Acetobacteraceae bacterium H6797]|nr:nucleoside 2-deoxyribosyltransferase [Acetobacteraceae bacterium H6797]